MTPCGIYLELEKAHICVMKYNTLFSVRLFTDSAWQQAKNGASKLTKSLSSGAQNLAARAKGVLN